MTGSPVRTIVAILVSLSAGVVVGLSVSGYEPAGDPGAPVARADVRDDDATRAGASSPAVGDRVGSPSEAQEDEQADDDGATTTAAGRGPIDPDAAAVDASPPTEPAAAPGVGPLAGAPVTRQEVARLEAPTALAARPGDAGVYVAERAGRVRLVGAPDTPTILDLSAQVGPGTGGLVGLAFDAEGAHLFLAYHGPDGHLRVDEVAVPGAGALDAASRREVLRVERPSGEANGGQLAVGADGLLHVAVGDGGPDAPTGTAADPQTRLGGLLRVDPRGGAGAAPYGVPAGNPFAGPTFGLDDVLATGLADPTGLAVDTSTGDLWLVDASGDVDRLSPDTVAGADLGAVSPLHRAPTASGCGPVGAAVARDAALPTLDGAVVVGDGCDGRLRALSVADGELVGVRDLEVDAPGLVGVAAGPGGRVHVLTADGAVSVVVPAG